MRKSSIVVIGIIIIIFVILGSILYLRSHNINTHQKSFIKVSREIKANQLSNMLNGIIHERFHNNFIRINYEDDIFIGHFKSKLGENGSSLILTAIITLRGLSYGYVSNSSSLIGYGYVREISCNFSEINYEGREKNIIRLIVKLDNATILYVRSLKSSKYCVKGILSIYYEGSYEDYKNSTEISTCISVIPLNASKIYFSKMLYLTDQLIIEKLEGLGIKFIPMLISNVTYLGRMHIGYFSCDAYAIDEVVNLSNLFNKKDFLVHVIDNVGKLLRIRVNTGILPEELSQVEDIVNLLGLSLWNFNSKFYICDNNLIYLKSHAHNVDNTIVSISVDIDIHVIGYRVYHNYINNTLYSEAMRMLDREAPGIGDVARFSSLWLSYMTITDPISRLLTSLIFLNLETNILDTLHAVWYVKSYEEHSISYSISVKNNRTLTLTIINSGREPISSLKLIVKGVREASYITVNCVVPVYENSSINIKCVKDYPCDINVIGKGRCFIKGLLKNFILPGVKYHVVLYIRFADGEVSVYKIPLLFNRSP